MEDQGFAEMQGLRDKTDEEKLDYAKTYLADHIVDLGGKAIRENQSQLFRMDSEVFSNSGTELVKQFLTSDVVFRMVADEEDWISSTVAEIFERAVEKLIDHEEDTSFLRAAQLIRLGYVLGQVGALDGILKEQE